MVQVTAVNAERFLDGFSGREIIVVGKSSDEGKEYVVWHFLSPLGDEIIEDRFIEKDKFAQRFVKPADGDVEWRVEPRKWHYGYEEDGERIGEAFASIRTDLGFETAEHFSEWLLAEGMRRYGQSENIDMPPVMIEAVEFPCLGWAEMMYVLDGVAKVLGVSPGSLLDEVLLRSSRHDVHGNQEED